MFDVGFAELFLLSIIGLLVLGPERLPAVARTLGGFMRKARSSWFQLKRSIESELAAAEIAEPLKKAQDEFKAVQEQVSEFGNESIMPPSPDNSTDKTPTPEQDSSKTAT